MEGKDDVPELRGITPNSFEYIFERIAQESGRSQFLVRC
jgi:kinesin family protein 3/17